MGGHCRQNFPADEWHLGGEMNGAALSTAFAVIRRTTHVMRVESNGEASMLRTSGVSEAGLMRLVVSCFRLSRRMVSQ